MGGHRGLAKGATMKIAKFEDFHVDGGWDTYSFLKVTTDQGLVGWAEFKESRRRGLGALIQGLGASLIGEDPRAIGRIDAALYSLIRTTTGGLQSNALAPSSMPASTSRARRSACRYTSCSAARCATASRSTGRAAAWCARAGPRSSTAT
jgi:hypothetical protein